MVASFAAQGFSFDALQPSSLVAHLQNRTLWMVGDIQVGAPPPWALGPRQG